VRPSREELIRELAAEPAPRARLLPAPLAALAWLAAAGALVAAATLATGPVRPGALGQLAREIGFALDVALGLATGAAAAWALMRLRVPGGGPGWRAALPALALFAAWGGLQLVLLVAGSPATPGGRPGCKLQVLAFAALPLAGGLLAARRAAPLARAWTGLLAGVAAGALGALAMELACLRDPAHALAAHLAPAVLVAAAGAALGPLVLRRV
jgi:hypothetical protein